MREAAAGLEALRVEVSEEVERDAVELALALAGKVIVATLQVRPELVVEVLQGALRRVSGQRSIAIVVNPADLETIRSSLGELREQTAAVERWDLQPDARVQAGGAIVRTVEGEVDACVATQLERAHEIVLAELGPRRGKPS
jgi:flagellar assembly protein FliH